MSGPGSALERARERFLGDGALDPDAAVRPEIVDSWTRSLRAGVDASRFEVPFRSDVDLDGSLSSAAAPVLDHLEETLAGTAVGVVLTDPDGRLLDRRVGEGELHRRLDGISLAPGFNYAEGFAGTNGVGTALQGAAATLVVGAEHFADRLQPFACAGAPIIHPLTGQLAGVIDITCMREQANGLMRVLAQQASRDIALVLRERGSLGARAVMAEFQAVCARSSHPVLAVAHDFLAANRTAQSVLGAADQERLRRCGAEYLHRPAGTSRPADLDAGPVRVRHTPISSTGTPVGLVLEVVPDAAETGERGSIPDAGGGRGSAPPGGSRRRLSPLEVAERDLIAAALVQAGGNRVRAAEALGTSRATLYRRLRAFGLTEVGRRASGPTGTGPAPPPP